MLKRFWLDEEGATMVEYILLIALLAVALIVVIRQFGGRIAALFRQKGQQIQQTGGTSY